MNAAIPSAMAPSPAPTSIRLLPLIAPIVFSDSAKGFIPTLATPSANPRPAAVTPSAAIPIKPAPNNTAPAPDIIIAPRPKIAPASTPRATAPFAILLQFTLLKD